MVRKIIGYRRNGCPIWEIRGGAEPVLEQGGTGGDGSGDLGDLLGGSDDPGAGSGDGGDGGTGGGDGGGEAPPAWWGAASASIVQATNAEIDRRINQLVNRRQQQQGQQGQQGNQGNGNGQAGQQPAGQNVGVDSSLLREGRAVFREALTDSGVKLSPVERDFVNAVAPGLIRSQLELSGDPDAAGASVASDISGRLSTLRKHYQDRTVAVLRSRGAIDEAKVKPGQPKQGQQQQGAGAMASGAEVARQIAEKRGLKTPGQK